MYLNYNYPTVRRTDDDARRYGNNPYAVQYVGGKHGVWVNADGDEISVDGCSAYGRQLLKKQGYHPKQG